MAESIDGKKDDLELPSMYDYYYYERAVFEHLSDFNKVREFFQNEKLELSSILPGYLFLFEANIYQLLNALETFLPDQNVGELVHWGNKDLNDDSIRELKSSKEFEHYFELHKAKKALSSLRLTPNAIISVGDVELRVGEIRTAVTGIDELIASRFDIKRIGKNTQFEQEIILGHITGEYGWIDADMPFDEGEKIKWHPPKPFAYLMTSESRRNFSKKEEECFPGYKYALFYLYNSLSLPDFQPIAEQMRLASDWETLHQVSKSVCEKYEKHFQIIPLFKIQETRPADPIKLPQILNKTLHFDIVFRGRGIRLLSELGRDIAEEDQVLFEQSLMGAVRLAQMHDEKADLIEFRERTPNSDDIEFTYALYVPLGATLWNGSFWLVFHSIQYEGDWEPVSFSRGRVEAYYKAFKDAIDLRTFEVNQKAFQDYLYSRDKIHLMKKNIEEKLNAVKGLLAEQFAGLYLLRKYGVDGTTMRFRSVAGNTDRDVFAENENTVFLCQAKSSMPSKSSEVRKHFEKLAESNTSKKPVKKILFVMQENNPEPEDSSFAVFLMDLGLDNIQVVNFSDLKKILVETGERGLISPSELVFIEKNDVDN